MQINNIAEVYSEMAEQIDDAVTGFRKDNPKTKYPVNFCYVAAVPVGESFLAIYAAVHVTKRDFRWCIIKEEPTTADEYLDLKSNTK